MTTRSCLPGTSEGDAAKPALNINLEDFAFALTWRSELGGSAHYLDTETGEVLFVGDGVDEDMIPPDLGHNLRYRPIDTLEPSEAFRVMADFVESLDGNAAMAEPLAAALGRPKPFRRFKDALQGDSAVRDAWFNFEREAHRVLGTAWCAEHGIDVAWT